VTHDEERWAEALAIERVHGQRAPLFVAERIGAAALVEDQAGITRWREVAAKLEALRSKPSALD